MEPIVVFCIITLLLCIIIFGYYERCTTVKIKNAKLRLRRYYDYFILEKRYFPGIWIDITKQELEIPTYVYTYIENVHIYGNDSFHDKLRTVNFKILHDKNEADEQFEMINSFTSLEKYTEYVKRRQEQLKTNT